MEIIIEDNIATVKYGNRVLCVGNFNGYCDLKRSVLEAISSLYDHCVEEQLNISFPIQLNSFKDLIKLTQNIEDITGSKFSNNNRR